MKSIHIERQSLPRNGRDEPSCPQCGGYNAMLHFSYEDYKHDDTKCRDCGHIHLVRDHDPLEQLRADVRYLKWQLDSERAIGTRAILVLEESYCEADYERFQQRHAANPTD